LQVKLCRLRSKGVYGLIQKDRLAERDRQSDFFAWTNLHFWYLFTYFDEIQQQ
jgi:hypothetical protein